MGPKNADTGRKIPGKTWHGQSTRGPSIVKAVRGNFRSCVVAPARKSKIDNCHETWSANQLPGNGVLTNYIDAQAHPLQIDKQTKRPDQGNSRRSQSLHTSTPLIDLQIGAIPK